MTSITATVRTHRRTYAPVGALIVVALAIVALLVVKTGPAHGLHDLVNSYHHLPHLIRLLLGAGHFGG
jgi:cytochrome b